jgi:hypothetical protein
LVAVGVGAVSGVGLITVVGVVAGEGEETAVFVAVTTATRVIVMVADAAISGAHPVTTITKLINDMIFNVRQFM